MCQVNGKDEILTPHSYHIFQPILMKLETKKDIWDTPHSQNLVDVGRRKGGLRRGEIFRYFLCSIYLFFVFLPSPSGHTRRPITTVYGSKRVFPRKVGPFGGFDDKK